MELCDEKGMEVLSGLWSSSSVIMEIAWKDKGNKKSDKYNWE